MGAEVCRLLCGNGLGNRCRLLGLLRNRRRLLELLRSRRGLLELLGSRRRLLVLLGSRRRLLVLLGNRYRLLILLGSRRRLLVLLGSRYRLLVLLGNLTLVLGSLIGVLRRKLRNTSLYKLLSLWLLCGVVVSVDTNGLTRCHDQLKADTEQYVAENSLRDESIDTVAALEGKCCNALEQKEDRACVVSDLDNACREEVLTVGALYELACVGILGFRSDDHYVEPDSCRNSDYRADQGDDKCRCGTAGSPVVSVAYRSGRFI